MAPSIPTHRPWITPTRLTLAVIAFAAASGFALVFAEPADAPHVGAVLCKLALAQR